MQLIKPSMRRMSGGLRRFKITSPKLRAGFTVTLTSLLFLIMGKNPTPRKCKGHWQSFIRHSRWKKFKKKEDFLVKDNFIDGKCVICGGVKPND
jgi:hypothetical protein